METHLTKVETFIFFISSLIFIGYYVFLIGRVLEKQITKSNFLLGLIPFSIWIIIFIDSFNELE